MPVQQQQRNSCPILPVKTMIVNPTLLSDRAGVATTGGARSIHCPVACEVRARRRRQVVRQETANLPPSVRFRPAPLSPDVLSSGARVVSDEEAGDSLWEPPAFSVAATGGWRCSRSRHPAAYLKPLSTSRGGMWGHARSVPFPRTRPTSQTAPCDPTGQGHNGRTCRNWSSCCGLSGASAVR